MRCQLPTPADTLVMLGRYLVPLATEAQQQLEATMLSRSTVWRLADIRKPLELTSPDKVADTLSSEWHMEFTSQSELSSAVLKMGGCQLRQLSPTPTVGCSPLLF